MKHAVAMAVRNGSGYSWLYCSELHISNYTPMQEVIKHVSSDERTETASMINTVMFEHYNEEKLADVKKYFCVTSFLLKV
jgi:hypothetical protein